MNNYSYPSLAVLLFALSPPCLAQVANADDIFNLPLNELINLRVSSANKQEASLFEAPAIITSWSHTDIELLGANDLADLANLTPSWFSYRNIGEYTLVTRGQMAGGFDNNRHLVLVDGIPVNHIRANSAPVDSHLPIFFANNIEFLRGPASALYGASAFYGVINIQSLAASATQSEHAHFQIQRSNLQEDTLLTSYFLKHGSHTRSALRFALQSQIADAEPLNNNFAHRDYNDQQSQFAYLTHGWHQGTLEGFSLGLYYSEKSGGLGNFWADYSQSENEINWSSSLFYVKYDKELSESLKVNNYYKYHYSSESARYLDASGDLVSSYNYPFYNNEVQTEWVWQLKQNHHFIGGLNIDTRYGEEKQVVVNNVERTTPRTPTLDSQSLWLQYQGDYRYNNLTLGLRHDRGSSDAENYQQSSPRIALVQKFSERLNIKFLYGEALRSPSVKELGVNNEVRVENPLIQLTDLRAETLVTYEISPFYKSGSSLISLTWFKTQTENFIARDWSNLGEYINLQNRIDSTGYEVEFNRLLNEKTKFLLNYSRSQSEDEFGVTLVDLPTSQFNVGVLWQNSIVSGSVTWRYVQGFSTREDQNKFDGFNSLDLNLIYSLSKSTELSLKLNNLADSEIVMPLAGEDGVSLRGREAILKFSHTL